MRYDFKRGYVWLRSLKKQRARQFPYTRRYAVSFNGYKKVYNNCKFSIAIQFGFKYIGLVIFEKDVK